jgi:hypothetical protein
MSKKKSARSTARAVRRDPPDLKKLSRALIALALEQAQAEADAQAEHGRQRKAGGSQRAA